MANLNTDFLKPGDVVIVAMGVWIIRWLIYVQSFLTGRAKYKESGHVIVVTHRDDQNRLWGIEGRPGGVGWAQLDKRNGKWGIANTDQPKDAAQRSKIVETMKSLLGTKYDYDAYLQIALQTIGINVSWTDFQGNQVPTHIICSAIADYVYEDVGLANPGGMKVTRLTTPAQWAEFIDKGDYKAWWKA
jgi:hypothetical protein